MSLKLATNGKSDKAFLLKSKFCPPGGCLSLGLYTCIKSWKKKCKNPTSKRFFLNLQQMNELTRHFCWHQNFVSWGLSDPGLYTCIKSWKKLKTSVFKEFLLKLATNDRSDKILLLTSKFRPQGVVSPCHGATYIYMYKIMKKWIKSDFKKLFLKLLTNDRSDKRFLLTSKFCPLGLSRPDLRLYVYTFIKSWTDVCKVRGWRVS